MRSARLILPILLSGAFSSPALASCWHNGERYVCAPGCVITRSWFDAFNRQWANYNCSQLYVLLFIALAVAVVLWFRFLFLKYWKSPAVEVLPVIQPAPTPATVYYYAPTEYQDFQYEQMLHMLQRQTAIENRLTGYLTARNKNQKLLADSTPAYTLNFNTNTPPVAAQPISPPVVNPQSVTIAPTPSEVDNLLQSLHEVTPETRETIVRLYDGLRKETVS